MEYLTATDTIAACATAKGNAALGIIRISGPEARSVLQAVVKTTRPIQKPRYMTYCQAYDLDTGAAIDEVMCFFANGPKTATGEDVAEIHCHGGTLVIAALLEAVTKSGAKPAQPGEFTARAFKNGRLDLTQAEAVMSLIDARSRRAAQVALKQLGGNTGVQLGNLWTALTNVAAQLEAGLDFPDEDLPQTAAAAMAAEITTIVASLEKVAGTFKLGARITGGADIVIAGPANAGKSSLLNLIIGEDKALVDKDPGTTRDLVEADFEIDGIPVRFTDTAGIREMAGRVEKRGIDKTQEAAQKADVLLLVLDGTAMTNLPDKTQGLLAASETVVVAVNKCDQAGWHETVPDWLADTVQVSTSALTGEGKEALLNALKSVLSGDMESSEVLLTTARQHDAVRSTIEHAERASEKLKMNSEPELAATELRWSMESLASLWGKSVTDSVIDAVFSTFCLGK